MMNEPPLDDLEQLPPKLDHVIDIPPPDEVHAELVDEKNPPPPELVDALVRYFNAERAALLNRVADIETLLGFIRDDNAALSVRVARLEAFVGLKG